MRNKYTVGFICADCGRPLDIDDEASKTNCPSAYDYVHEVRVKPCMICQRKHEEAFFTAVNVERLRRLENAK